MTFPTFDIDADDALHPGMARPATPYRYRAFGLVIESDIRMDELSPTDTKTQKMDEVRIELADMAIDLPGREDASSWMDFDPVQGVMMAWPGIVAVHISPELDRIRVQPFPGVPQRYLAFPILGPVFGWLLHARGALVLHASAVGLDGGGVAFVGDKGAGKSTTASAFLSAGAELLTDDLLVIDPVDPVPQIQPAFAQVKLNADAAKQTRPDGADELPLVFDGFPKQQFRLSEMVHKPVPCRAVLTLQRGGDRPHIRWHDPTQSLLNIMRYTYAARFTTAPGAMWRRDRHLQLCSRAITMINVGTLHVPASLDRLTDVVQTVRTELDRLEREPPS